MSQKWDSGVALVNATGLERLRAEENFRYVERPGGGQHVYDASGKRIGGITPDGKIYQDQGW